MKIDNIGNCLIELDDVIDHLMSGGDVSDVTGHTVTFPCREYNHLVSRIDHDNWQIKPIMEYSTAEEMDRESQAHWYIPPEYTDLDIANWLLEQCQDAYARIRVEQELKEFKSRNLITVLQALKYLVDTMRENSIVWGVGRGSSVASYCLYLLGVHSVDSIKYNLDFTEFID